MFSICNGIKHVRQLQTPESTLTEDSQGKNGDQSVVSTLTEKSQKLHCHKQAYFLLQLHISAISQYSRPAKAMVEASVPTVKEIKTALSKNHTSTLQDQYVIFHEAK